MHLTEFARVRTSGARAVEHFVIDGRNLLAIPQLAYDLPGTEADMNGGNSDTTLLILEQLGDGFAVVQELDAPGGEDAEFFVIGGHKFLASASLRSGAGPYDFHPGSTLWEWTGSSFEAFQRFDTFAAKQWRYFTVGERHFLGLAQGVGMPAFQDQNKPSEILEWSGERFEPFQILEDSEWGYNWYRFDIDDQQFLAYADHTRPSVLLRWTGSRFEHVQDLAKRHGRAFATVVRDGVTYLLVARLMDTSFVLRWDGTRFVDHQQLDGLGAREFAAFDDRVLRINFIEGTQAAPITALNSVVYRWDGDQLAVDTTFTTLGGTDAATWTDPRHGRLIAVSNSLDASVRFATDAVVYRFSED